jgi:hypothetical protein
MHVQTCIEGTDVQKNFSEGIVRYSFAKDMIARGKARKKAGLTAVVGESLDRLSWCTWANFDGYYSSVMDECVRLKIGRRTSMALDVKCGIVFEWLEPDRCGVGDETDLPLAERTIAGRTAKTVCAFEKSDEQNKIRRLLEIPEIVTRRSINKGGSLKTSLMAGSTMAGQAYADLTMHKASALPKDEVVPETGQVWNVWTHTLDVEAAKEKVKLARSPLPAQAAQHNSALAGGCRGTVCTTSGLCERTAKMWSAKRSRTARVAWTRRPFASG